MLTEVDEGAAAAGVKARWEGKLTLLWVAKNCSPSIGRAAGDALRLLAFSS